VSKYTLRLASAGGVACGMSAAVMYYMYTPAASPTGALPASCNARVYTCFFKIHKIYYVVGQYCAHILGAINRAATIQSHLTFGTIYTATKANDDIHRHI